MAIARVPARHIIKVMDGLSPPSNAKPRTVLVIEDEDAFRDSLVETLKAIGCQVRSCANGEEGVALALEIKPTLVVSDVHLVSGDGRKVLRELRENEAMRYCQFIMMTGDWVGASKKTSIELEADSYLAKPFSIQEFIACVEERFREADL
jgi:two-component system OmpR family response regulator